MPTYDIKQYSPTYGGMITEDGEVENIVDLIKNGVGKDFKDLGLSVVDGAVNITYEEV